MISFIFMCVVMELTPGPNMGYLAVLSLTNGRRAGFEAVLGVALGLLIIGLLGAFGVAVAVSTSPLLYQILRWGGVVYLLWLAWDGWRAADQDAVPAPPKAGFMDGRFFVRGFVTNILNPKAFLFYVSVLPNFIPAGPDTLSPALGLTAIYVTIATGVHCLIVTVAGTMRRFLDTPHVVKMVSRVLSLLLVGIAFWVLAET